MEQKLECKTMSKWVKIFDLTLTLFTAYTKAQKLVFSVRKLARKKRLSRTNNVPFG